MASFLSGDPQMWGETAEKVIGKMAAILGEATDQDPAEFLAELRVLVNDAKKSSEEDRLMTANQFECVFLVVCMAMVGIFGELRRVIDKDKIHIIDEAVEMLLPHIHMMGIQGILALERLRLN